MTTLMCYDRTKQLTPAQRVAGAIESYRRKFGAEPNVCYVPLAEYDETIEIAGVRVVGRRDVLARHVQVGTV